MADISGKIRDLAYGLGDSSTKQKIISLADTLEEKEIQLQQENAQLKRQVASLQQQPSLMTMSSALIDETLDEIEYNEEKMPHQAQKLKWTEREETLEEFADDKPEKTKEFWEDLVLKLKERDIDFVKVWYCPILTRRFFSFIHSRSS